MGNLKQLVASTLNITIGGMTSVKRVLRSPAQL